MWKIKLSILHDLYDAVVFAARFAQQLYESTKIRVCDAKSKSNVSNNFQSQGVYKIT